MTNCLSIAARAPVFALVAGAATSLSAQTGIGVTAPTNALHVGLGPTPGPADEPLRVEGLKASEATDTLLLVADPVTGVIRYRTLSAVAGEVDTDEQDLAIAGGNLAITNGASVPLSAFGDDLGDHVARENVRMGGFWLSRDGDPEGLLVDGDGSTTLRTVPTTVALYVPRVMPLSGTGGGGVRLGVSRFLSLDSARIQAGSALGGQALDLNPFGGVVVVGGNAGGGALALRNRGQTQLQDLPAGNGADDIVTVDAVGNLRKRTLSDVNSTAPGDDLGNHVATQNIRLDGNWLSRDGDSEGVLVDGNGSTVVRAVTTDVALRIPRFTPLTAFGGGGLQVGTDRFLALDSTAIQSTGVGGGGPKLLHLNPFGGDVTTGANFNVSSAHALLAAGGATFNEAGANADFRVETPGSTHALYVSGTADAVGIGTSAITAGTTLEVGGKTRTTALQLTTGATAGYVLQSDAQGNGTWVASGGIGTDNQTLAVSGGDLTISGGNSVALAALGDDLGDHTADRNLRLDGNWLSRDGDPEGLFVDGDGTAVLRGVPTNVALRVPRAQVLTAYGGGGVQLGAERFLAVDSTGLQSTGIGAFPGPKDLELNPFGGTVVVGHKAGTSGFATQLDNYGTTKLRDVTAVATLLQGTANERAILLRDPDGLVVEIDKSDFDAVVSDRRLKSAIAPDTTGLSAVRRLQAYTFVYSDDTERELHHGVMAQEVQAVLPELVVTRGDGTLAVEYDELTPVVLGAVKALDAQLQAERRRCDALEARLRALEDAPENR